MNSNGERMLLTYILCVPFAVTLVCIFVRRRAVIGLLNVAGFLVSLGLSWRLLRAVLGNAGAPVVEWNEFLRADALSAWMALLVSFVSAVASLYAVRHFRSKVGEAALNAKRCREFYILTPLFGGGMLFVVLANNLGVMWIAMEAAAVTSVPLTWVSILILAALLIVFCGMLNKISGLLLGRADGRSASESLSVSTVAAMGLPLGMLLLFTAWLPNPVRQLITEAAGIIRGTP